MLQGCVHVPLVKQAVPVDAQCRPSVPASACRRVLLAIPALHACMQHGCHNGCCHVACGCPDHAEIHHIDACQDARQLGNMAARHKPHLHSNTHAHTHSQVRLQALKSRQEPNPVKWLKMSLVRSSPLRSLDISYVSLQHTPCV